MKKGALKTQLMRPVDRVTEFLNSRTLREKQMFIGFFAVAVLTADYFLILAPSLGTFQEFAPKAAELRREKQGWTDDIKSSADIKKKWEAARAMAAEQEKAAISANATSALLENLSQEARQTGVKITSVKPIEAPRGGGKNAKLFSPLPIKLSAVAGTHELGKFLSRLESGQTFFRVTDMTITASLSDRRHQVELSLEAVRRDAEPDKKS